MAYRGEDLDLRTPQNRGAQGEPSGEAAWLTGARTRAGYRNDTIWVDDTLLSACNHAFEIAVAHRAAEVRLEHLIYALTRIDAAGDSLEARGVRVASLRREVGSIVANDIAMVAASGKVNPRRSDELEDVLRFAADLAYRRNAPAGIEDLISVLLDAKRDIPASVLLRRHATARQDYQPVPPRYQEPERERVRMPAGSFYVGSPTDSIQNTRIDALEQAFRALQADLQSDRKVLGTYSTLLKDIQRDVSAQRDDDGRLGGGVQDRMAAIELAIEKRLTDLARSWSLIGDRLQALELSLHKVRPDGNAEFAALHERLTGLERTLQTSSAEAGRTWTNVNDRMKAIDTLLSSRGVGGPTDLTARLESIEQMVLDRAAEAGTENGRIAERLKAIEDGQGAQRMHAVQLNAAVAAEVNRLASTLDGKVIADRVQAVLNERLQGIGGLLERQRSELSGAVVQPVIDRMAALGAALESRQLETTRTLAQMHERVSAMERNMGGSVQRIADQANGYDQDLGEIQDALLKLHANQQTLAATLEQWRQQGVNEAGVIGNRLTAIERLTSRPAQMIEMLSAKIDSMHRVTTERVERRNRFFYWLFGTDNWVSASWPSRKQS